MIDLGIVPAPWARLAARAVTSWPTGAQRELVEWLRSQRESYLLGALGAAIEDLSPRDIDASHLVRGACA